jgi:hypothetical protein
MVPGNHDVNRAKLSVVAEPLLGGKGRPIHSMNSSLLCTVSVSRSTSSGGRHKR